MAGNQLSTADLAVDGDLTERRIARLERVQQAKAIRPISVWAKSMR